MAVAGGIFTELKCYIQDEMPLVMGVAFTGSGVSVASTVLDRNVRTEREADSLMKEVCKTDKLFLDSLAITPILNVRLTA